MIIKRYVVDNMNEAMIKIRYELGSEAVIVSQRKIRQKGFLGIFKAQKIEVTAAVDDKSKKSNSPQEDKKETQNEITEIKLMIEKLITQNVSEQKKDTRSKWKVKLIDNDIPSEIVNNIYTTIKDNNKDKKLTAKDYDTEVIKILTKMIKTSSNKSERIQVLVGPTGVGKTTTVAKLASMYTLYMNKRIGLITIDTYRIGAVEQLKAYADILGVPFGVIISSTDIPIVLEKMKDCDIILIDTTGRNSKNMMQISEIRKYVEELKPNKVHLVLSMTTKQKDIEKIVRNYKIVNYNSLILTKLDETDVYGSLITPVFYSNVPISFITTGQNVPEDIEEANADKLVKLIMGAGE